MYKPPYRINNIFQCSGIIEFKVSLFPPQHLVYRAANSSGALHNEASLPCLLQENMSQQYCLHQPSCTHGGLISPCWCLSLIFCFLFSPFETLMGTDISINRRNYFLECQRHTLCSFCMFWVQLKYTQRSWW